ncbi:MAG: hypothetical protein QOK85_00900, partial [Nitrososphaeraceae archaeon]|nr:hypothetical protein [Nitrososphaeraceae archaeon]
ILTDICLNQHCLKIFKIGQNYQLELQIRIHRNYTPMGLEPYVMTDKIPSANIMALCQRVNYYSE